MIFISVVRNHEMYHNLVTNNPYNKGHQFISYDNNLENITIPLRYNHFLDNYDYSKPDWFVFCHEDWELKEDLEKRLCDLDKNHLYGPIGVDLNYKIFRLHPLKGQIENSHKDGSGHTLIGHRVKTISQVGTFDCQCIIIHSSLVEKYHLRFDENLTWDLYVEDFCIGAKERHNISSYILQLKCQHYSYGKITERFYTQYSYLQKKYIDAKNIYISTCSNIPIGKKVPFSYKILDIVFTIYRKAIRFFWQKKITKSGKMIVKICKIPVFRRRIK